MESKNIFALTGGDIEFLESGWDRNPLGQIDGLLQRKTKQLQRRFRTIEEKAQACLGFASYLQQCYDKDSVEQKLIGSFTISPPNTARGVIRAFYKITMGYAPRANIREMREVQRTRDCLLGFCKHIDGLHLKEAAQAKAAKDKTKEFLHSLYRFRMETLCQEIIKAFTDMDALANEALGYRRTLQRYRMTRSLSE